MDLRLAGDSLPVEALQSGVFFKYFLVLNQHAPHDARVVRTAQFQNAVRDDAYFLVRVEQRKHRLRQGLIGQFLIGAFDRVLDGVGQKFQLVHEMGKFRRVDLSEFEFPLGQLPQNFFCNGGRNGAGSAVHEPGNFGHDGGNL